jgi:hypothetical protein
MGWEWVNRKAPGGRWCPSALPALLAGVVPEEGSELSSFSLSSDRDGTCQPRWVGVWYRQRPRGSLMPSPSSHPLARVLPSSAGTLANRHRGLGRGEGGWF